MYVTGALDASASDEYWIEWLKLLSESRRGWKMGQDHGTDGTRGSNEVNLFLESAGATKFFGKLNMA